MKGLRNLLNKDYEDFLQQKYEQNNQNKLITKRTVATRESGRPIGSRINQRLQKPDSASQSMGNLFANVKANLFTNPKHSLQQEATPFLTEQQEKFIVKQYWRSLLRWQGFDDYLFLRDPLSHPELRQKELLNVYNNHIQNPLKISSFQNSMYYFQIKYPLLDFCFINKLYLQLQQSIKFINSLFHINYICVIILFQQ